MTKSQHLPVGIQHRMTIPALLLGSMWGVVGRNNSPGTKTTLWQAANAHFNMELSQNQSWAIVKTTLMTTAEFCVANASY